MLRERSMEEAKRMTQNLTCTILFMQQKEAAQPGQYANALKRFMDIISDITRGLEDDYIAPNQTLSAPTTRQAIQEAPKHIAN